MPSPIPSNAKVSRELHSLDLPLCSKSIGVKAREVDLATLGRRFASLLARAREGTEVVIEHDERLVAVRRPAEAPS
jgi:hypothetical protein